MDHQKPEEIKPDERIKEDEDEFLGEYTFLAVLKDAVFFPKIVYWGLPFLMYLSLFHIPENYAGILPYARSINGTYQNRWLYDMLGFYGLFLSFWALLKYFTVGVSNNTKRLIIKNFNVNKNKNEKLLRIYDFEPWVIEIFIFILVICLFAVANIYTFNAIDNTKEWYQCEGVRGNRYCLSWNGNVFGNFFIEGLFWIVEKILFVHFAIYLLLFNREINRKRYG